MCDLVKDVTPEGNSVYFTDGTVYRVVSTDEFNHGLEGAAVAPLEGDDMVYVFSSPDREAAGDVLYCRHPDANGEGGWEEVAWPQEGEAVSVPLGAELKLVLANPGLVLTGMV